MVCFRKFLLLFVNWHICLTIDLERPEMVKEDFVTDILGLIMSNRLDSCLTVMSHDYEVLPDPLTNLLRARSEQEKPSVTLRYQDLIQTVQEEVKVNHTEVLYWFSWLTRPSTVSLANCNMFVLIWEGDKFQDMMEQTAAVVSMHLAKDYFFLWNRDLKGNSSDVLHHPIAQKLKFKLTPSFLEGDQSDDVTLQSVCFFCNGGDPQVVHVLEDFYPDFTTDLHGKFMHIGFLEGFTKEDTEYAIANIEPTFPPPLHVWELGRTMNFNWTVDRLKAGAASAADTQLDDGTWTGNVGAILYEEVEMIPFALIHPNGFPVVDYVSPSFYDSVGLLNRVPRPVYSWRVVVQPYTLDMWMAILIACALASLTFYGILKGLALVSDPFPRRRTFSLLPYSFTYVLLALIEENPENVPRHNSARLFLSLWWTFAVVITCGYTSKLIGFLCVPDKEDLPGSLKEALTDPKWTYGCYSLHCIFAHLVLEDADPEHFAFLLDKMDLLLQFDSLEECLEHTIDHQYSCFTATIFLRFTAYEYLDVNGATPFNVIDDPLIKMYFGTSLPKYSILSPTVNSVTSYLWCSGIGFQQEDFTYYSYFRSGLKKAREMHILHDGLSMKLNIKQVKGVFYALVIFAYGIGPLLLVLECIVHKFKD